MLKAAIPAFIILLLNAPLAGAQSASSDVYPGDETQNPWANTTQDQNSQQPANQRPGMNSNMGTPQLNQTVTAMPIPGTTYAGGSFALKAQGLTNLQPTTLETLSNKNSAVLENVIGDEEAYLNGYGPKNAIVNLLSPGLSTGHKSDAPPVSSGY